jgi:hypothetical protein
MNNTSTSTTIGLKLDRKRFYVIENPRNCKCEIKCYADCYLDCDCECKEHPIKSDIISLSLLKEITGNETLQARSLYK